MLVAIRTGQRLGLATTSVSSGIVGLFQQKCSKVCGKAVLKQRSLRKTRNLIQIALRRCNDCELPAEIRAGRGEGESDVIRVTATRVPSFRENGGATPVKSIAPSKSSCKSYRLPGQSGDPIALRLCVFQTEAYNLRASRFVQRSRKREAFASSEPKR